MLIAMENPVPQSLFTVYVTGHTEDAAAGAAACPVAADAPMTPAATRVPAASEQAAAQTAAERPGDRFINTRIHILLAGTGCPCVQAQPKKLGWEGEGKRFPEGEPGSCDGRNGRTAVRGAKALIGLRHERFIVMWGRGPWCGKKNVVVVATTTNAPGRDPFRRPQWPLRSQPSHGVGRPPR